MGSGTTFTITIPFSNDHLPKKHINSKAEPTTMGHHYSGYVAEALRWLPSDTAGEELVLTVDAAPRINGMKDDQRILIVDDNSDMREYLSYLLHGHGYHVETAPDGLVALELIGKRLPDLVLSDLMMPKLDGLGLLARLRASEATRELPFIALSARAGEESKIEGLKAGADAYLVKPFSSRELFARVGSAIELAGVRRKAREALEDEHGRLQRLFEQAPGFIATVRGPDHVFEFANASYRRLIGNRNIIGKSVASALPEVLDQGFIQLLDEVYRTGRPFIAENLPARLQQSVDAPLSDVVLNFVYEAITDSDGTIVGVFVEGHDVSKQHQANQHLQLLVKELNHRVKNMLAIVQSVSQQTFKSALSAEDERKAFDGRLQALASAHDLLTRNNWESPMLANVAREAFGFRSDDNAISVSGPPVCLSPQTAVTLAMAIHELTTNAIKYGALSVPAGYVDLSWEVVLEPDPRLSLVWRERDGPTVEPPTKRGFGSRLIERALAAELGGDVWLDFQPDGMVCRINAPLPEGASK